MVNVYYSINKLYKGIFKKRHHSNIQILTIPDEFSKHSMYIVVGEIEGKKNSYALVATTSGESSRIDDILLQIQDYEKGFEIIEKIPCARQKKGGITLITLKKKGKHILSDFKLEYRADYSSSSERIYFLQGKLNLLETEPIKSNSQLKMMAKKKFSLFTAIKNAFKRKE